MTAQTAADIYFFDVYRANKQLFDVSIDILLCNIDLAKDRNADLARFNNMLIFNIRGVAKMDERYFANVIDFGELLVKS